MPADGPGMDQELDADHQQGRDVDTQTKTFLRQSSVVRLGRLGHISPEEDPAMENNHRMPETLEKPEEDLSCRQEGVA